VWLINGCGDYRRISAPRIGLRTLTGYRHPRILTLWTDRSAESIVEWIQGKSVDTLMGMTPLEGPTMGPRCGDLAVQMRKRRRDGIAYNYTNL
jgi:hypothetical protein